MYDILELNKKLVSELRDIAKELKVKKVDILKKQDLVYKILDQQAIVATETKQANKKSSVSNKNVSKRYEVKKNYRSEKLEPHITEKENEKRIDNEDEKIDNKLDNTDNKIIHTGISDKPIDSSSDYNEIKNHKKPLLNKEK